MRERKLTFCAANVLTAVSLIASLYENFFGSIAECSISPAANDMWAVTVRMTGSHADELFDFLLVRLTSRGEVIRDDA